MNLKFHLFAEATEPVNSIDVCAGVKFSKLENFLWQSWVLIIEITRAVRIIILHHKI